MKFLILSSYIACIAATTHGSKMVPDVPGQKVVDVGVYYTPVTRSGICKNVRLPAGCSLSADCSIVNCKCPFGGQNFEVELRINKCESPVTLTASAKVPILNINFCHTFPTSQRLPIPGIGQNLGPIQGGVFINVQMNSGSTNVHLVVSLETGIVIAGNPLVPIKLDLINGDLPITTDGCDGGGEPPGPEPPVPSCQDKDPLCIFRGFLCLFDANTQRDCRRTCKKC